LPRTDDREAGGDEIEEVIEIVSSGAELVYAIEAIHERRYRPLCAQAVVTVLVG
jgi:hypothetical protein